MKRNKLLKFIALIVSAVSITAAFSGCIINYNEEADMSQIVLEVKPVEIEHNIPVMGAYLDANGNPVTATESVLGEKSNLTVENGVVQAVKRTHDGAAIHVPQLDDSGNILYEKTGVTDGKATVEAVTATNADKEETSERYAVVYTVNNKVVDADEYYYVGKAKVGDKDVALWSNTDNTKAKVYGAISVDGATPAPVSGITNAVDELPVIYYDSSKPIDSNFYWNRLTPVYATDTYVAEKSDQYFKVTFLSYLNNNAQQMLQTEGKTVEEMFEHFVKQFYTSTFTRWEIDAATEAGNVEWGVTEENELKRFIYSGIDAVLESLYTEIAEDFDTTYPSAGQNSSTETTYPTPEEEAKDDVFAKEYKVWDITLESARLVGNTDNKELASMQREGVRRFVDYVETAIDDSYSIPATDRAIYESEIAEMREACKKVEDIDDLYANKVEDIDDLYANLDDYDVIHYMYGDNQEYSMKTENFKDYLTISRNIKQNIEEDYKSELASQKEKFGENIENYYTAATGEDTVLYFADDEYFWVKHILIPFSDEQTAYFEEFKKTNSDASIEEKREQLGREVVVYKHVNGEDDTSVEYTIDQAWADIYGTMSGKTGYEAERAFTDLIYTYNTDPGIFDSKMGYAVTATPASKGGKSEQYMIEFAKESRALLNAYNNNQSLLEYKTSDSEYKVTKYDSDLTAEVEIGSISAPVLTDYGWHIMYLSYVPTPGTWRALDEYLTAGRYETVRDVLTVEVTNKTYDSWKESVANKYSEMEGVVKSDIGTLRTRLDELEDAYYNPPEPEEEEEEEEGSTAVTA